MNDKLNIFYADDDQDDLDFFKLVIRKISNQYEVITHMDGHQLMDALEFPSPIPHLVFLDINMPKMNGLEVLKKLRASEKFRNLPVIMFSTTDDSAIVQQALELGASCYLPKPSGITELKESIEQLLQRDWKTFVPNSVTFKYSSN